MNCSEEEEEADTLLILYAAGIHKTGLITYYNALDTDAMVLAISAIEKLRDITHLS